MNRNRNKKMKKIVKTIQDQMKNLILKMTQRIKQRRNRIQNLKYNLKKINLKNKQIEMKYLHSSMMKDQRNRIMILNYFRKYMTLMNLNFLKLNLKIILLLLGK